MHSRFCNLLSTSARVLKIRSNCVAIFFRYVQSFQHLIVFAKYSTFVWFRSWTVAGFFPVWRENVALRANTTACLHFAFRAMSHRLGLRTRRLVPRAPWTRAAVMLEQYLYFPRLPPSLYHFKLRLSPLWVHMKQRWPSVPVRAGSWRSYEKIGDCEQSTVWFFVSFYLGSKNTKT